MNGEERKGHNLFCNNAQSPILFCMLCRMLFRLPNSLTHMPFHPFIVTHYISMYNIVSSSLVMCGAFCCWYHNWSHYLNFQKAESKMTVNAHDYNTLKLHHSEECDDDGPSLWTANHRCHDLFASQGGSFSRCELFSGKMVKPGQTWAGHSHLCFIMDSTIMNSKWQVNFFIFIHTWNHIPNYETEEWIKSICLTSLTHPA